MNIIALFSKTYNSWNPYYGSTLPSAPVKNVGDRKTNKKKIVFIDFSVYFYRKNKSQNILIKKTNKLLF